jgi:predicted TIM-barrel fold metal-dependent hydrolase
VQDANYVETLGAYGIAKAFTTGGARGQAIEETIHIFEDQYFERVVFQTPAGKRYAQEMRAYTRDFLKRLKDELKVCCHNPGDFVGGIVRDSGRIKKEERRNIKTYWGPS